MSNKNLDIFHNFIRSNQYLLEKGDNNWPTERILYQLAYEHAKDSPITKQAEKYFNDGRIAYTHFKKINRTKNLKLNSNFMTLTGHTQPIEGVNLTRDNQALSWSDDGTLRLWDLKSGSSKVFKGHTDWVQGVHLIEDDQALSWSYDRTLRLCNFKDGSSKVFEGHTGAVVGVHLMENNQALSWSDDGTLRLWDLKSGSSEVFEGHTEVVLGVYLLENNQALSWSWDGTLRLWDLKAGSSKVFEGHAKSVKGVHLMENNQALSWSLDGTLRLWDLTNDIVTKYFFGGINQVFLTNFPNRILCFNSISRHRILDLSDQFKIE